MPDVGGFGGLSRRLDMLAKDLTGQGRREMLTKVGRAMAREVGNAVQRELGDDSMSGWRRRKPIAIKGAADLTGNGVEIAPVKQARGPMRVLEQGRNMGNAAGFAGPGVDRSTGLTARTKSGQVRKVRARKARRWNGYTQGKGTWTEATTTIADKAPGAFNDEKVAALARYFRRG